MKKMTVFLALACLVLAGCPKPPQRQDDPKFEFSRTPDQGGVLTGKVMGVNNPADWELWLHFGAGNVWRKFPFELLRDNGTFNADLRDFVWQRKSSAALLTLVRKGVEVPDCEEGCADQPVVQGSLTQLFRYPMTWAYAGGISLHTPYWGDENGLVTGVVEGDTEGFVLAVYTELDGSWRLMNNCQPTPITDGSFTVDITPEGEEEAEAYSTHVGAVLVPFGTELPCIITPGEGTKAATEDDPFADLGAVDKTIVNRVPLLGLTRVPSPTDETGRWEFVVVAPHPEQYAIWLYVHEADGWQMLPNPGTPIGVLANGTAFAVIGNPAEDQVWIHLAPVGVQLPACSNADPCESLQVPQSVGDIWLSRQAGLDLIAPRIVLTDGAEIDHEAGTSFSDPGYTASDETDGDLTNRVVVTGSVDGETLGDYTLNYSVIDNAGNRGTATRLVHVMDTQEPEITVTGQNPVSVQVDSTYTDEGATAMDSFEGDLTSEIQMASTVNTATAGTYTVTYTVQDSSGNTATATRTVNVVEGEPDNTAPEITLVGANPMPVEVGGTYTEPGATAADNVDGDVSEAIVIEGVVNSAVIGDYIITYRVSDAAGNEAMVTRVVEVRDTTDPTIAEVADFEMPQHATAEFSLSGTDNHDTSLTWTVTSSHEDIVTVAVSGADVTVTSHNVSGVATITITATDDSGNTATQEVVVTVTAFGSPTVQVTAEPGSDSEDTSVVRGFVGGISDYAAYRLAVYVQVKITGEDGVDRWYWFLKPAFGAQGYTVINTDGTWSQTISPDQNKWTRVQIHLVPVGAEIPQCGAEGSPCEANAETQGDQIEIADSIASITIVNEAAL